MKVKESQKLLPWTKKDFISNAFVYLINAVVIFLIFIGAFFFDNLNSTVVIYDFEQNKMTALNYLFVILLTMLFLFLFFYYDNRDFLKNAHNSEMVFLIIELGLILSFLSGYYVNPYIRPLAFIAIITYFLSDTKTAVAVNIFYNIIQMCFDSFSGIIDFYSVYPEVYNFIMGFFSGLLGIFCVKLVYSRIKLTICGFLLSFPTIICNIIPIVNFGQGDIFSIISSLFSGPLSIVCLLIFLPIFEVLFKKISAFRLAELTDHNSKLIKRLIEQAPGTFNHSLVVANIAEACATAIGENALLARVCAYYHDIGKLRRPEFFKENQTDGENPHEELTPELSANIIKSHTKDGFSFIMNNRLPEMLADICIEHHGTMPIIYFYDKAKKLTDGEVSLNTFRYQGVKPQSKISAIIMIADGCEAVARSLKDRSRESVNQAVKNIVNERMQLGQFDECEITIKELNIIINTVVNSLTGVYHDRVEYPKVSLDGIESDSVNVSDNTDNAENSADTSKE